MDLHGSCGCGRNVFVVELPNTSSQLAQVYFDSSSSNRRHLATPVTAWLRVPLAWFYSATFAFFPDEEHRTIRKSFTSPFDQHTRRQFCGYCGTQLTLWKDSEEGEEDFIHLTLGSLFDEDLERLEELGLLQVREEEEPETVAGDTQTDTAVQVQRTSQRGQPWFESMVEDSRLGRLTRQKGGHTSEDGSVSVEWEVVEWTGEESSEGVGTTSGKRKLGEVDENADTQMRT